MYAKSVTVRGGITIRRLVLVNGWIRVVSVMEVVNVQAVMAKDTDINSHYFCFSRKHNVNVGKM